MDNKEKKLIKTRECVHCEHLFSCKGRSREVKQCVHFEKRK